MDGSIQNRNSSYSSSRDTNGVSIIAMRTIYDFNTKTHYLHGDERSIENIAGIEDATWERLKNDDKFQPPYSIINLLK